MPRWICHQNKHIRNTQQANFVMIRWHPSYIQVNIQGAPTTRVLDLPNLDRCLKFWLSTRTWPNPAQHITRMYFLTSSILAYLLRKLRCLPTIPVTNQLLASWVYTHCISHVIYRIIPQGIYLFMWTQNPNWEGLRSKLLQSWIDTDGEGLESSSKKM